MKRLKSVSTLGMLLFLFGFSPGSYSAFAQDDIKPEEFESLFHSIKPCKEREAWLSLPWRADLFNARQLAAQENRPIFLWMMDGHPLCCV